MSTNYGANIEFLSFLADISDPGNGAISKERLACWLGLDVVDLIDRWQRSGKAEWAEFADDVLHVLDQMQDQTCSLAGTLAWYRYFPLSDQGAATADELVSLGCTSEVIFRLRKARETRPSHGSRASPRR